MGMLEKLEEIKSVELLAFNCNDGISIIINNLTPQIAKDFVRYQSINKTGQVYLPRDIDKIALAKWFIIRGCEVHFSINQDISLHWLKKWQCKQKIKDLNRQI